jgi:hypothetical protein
MGEKPPELLLWETCLGFPGGFLSIFDGYSERSLEVDLWAYYSSKYWTFSGTWGGGELEFGEKWELEFGDSIASFEAPRISVNRLRSRI